MRMDISIREQTNEMDRPAVSCTLNDPAPQICFKHLARLYRLVDQTGALIKNPPGPEGIVSHLAVTHVLVRGQTHGVAMGPVSG